MPIPPTFPSDRPAVSVVMPAFNAERTVYAAVHSVLAQTYEALELLVCDDDSVDGTLEILTRIGDPRLKVLASGANQGPGGARDRAIAAATAPWIAVMDADDWWDPYRLEVLMGAREDEEDVMVFDDLMQCHDTVDGLVPWRRLRGDSCFGQSSSQPRDIPVDKFLVASRLLIKPIFPADVVRNHKITHSRRPFGEDAEFFLRLAATGLRMRYVPQALYHYRITPGSATASAPRRTLMRESLVECLDLPGFDASVRAALQSKILSLERDEALYAVRDLWRQRAFNTLFRRLVSNPALLWPGIRRVVSIMAYEVHRRLSRGRGR